jgi:hypothetical protein
VRLNVPGTEGAGVSPAPFSATSLPSPRKK